MDGQASLPLCCLHATKSSLDKAHITIAKSHYKHALDIHLVKKQICALSDVLLNISLAGGQSLK